MKTWRKVYGVPDNEWKNLYHDLSILYPSDKKPILWLDNKNTNILYYAGLKQKDDINNNGYNIQIYSLDVRDNKQWNLCYKDWDDLKLHNFDYDSAQLFK